MPKRQREEVSESEKRRRLEDIMLTHPEFEDIKEAEVFLMKTKNFGKKKSRKPRKLGKLSLLKKDLRTTRTKSKLSAQKAETELAQLERRKSRKLTWVERK